MSPALIVESAQRPKWLEYVSRMEVGKTVEMLHQQTPESVSRLKEDQKEGGGNM